MRPFAILVLLFLGPGFLRAALPGPWPRSRPEEAGMDVRGLEAARDYATGVEGSAYVIRHGRLVHAWGDPKKLYDLKCASRQYRNG